MFAGKALRSAEADALNGTISCYAKKIDDQVNTSVSDFAPSASFESHSLASWSSDNIAFFLRSASAPYQHRSRTGQLTPPSAYNYALNLLAARPYSTRALHRKLIQKEYSAADSDDAIRRLVDAGLLNDEKYAEQYARSKMLSTGASRRRLTQDLYRKGIKGDVASTAIANVIADEEIDTAAVVEQVARKKLAQLGDLEPLVLRRRLFGFLARRGYDVDEIKRVVSSLT